MAYGTNSFTDRYGDFKQPTVIDYDISSVIRFSSESITEDILKEFEENKLSTIENILKTNPVFGGVKYQHLTAAVDGKLIWNKSKILELSSNIDWLYALNRYIKKNKLYKFNT